MKTAAARWLLFPLLASWGRPVFAQGNIYCGSDQVVNTALGCIPVTPGGLFGAFFPKLTGIAGGIAFLLIIFGGFQMMTSAGNPEKLNAGRELVTSAVAGLLMIIFSVFLLRLIGVDILGIPGFR